jgi:hypothetical protein
MYVYEIAYALSDVIGDGKVSLRPSQPKCLTGQHRYISRSNYGTAKIAKYHHYLSTFVSR